MTPNGFAHLHLHTDGSMRDGLGTISRLVRAAKEKGFTALSMTDHGTLANAVTFTNECNANGIKPILGLEAYLDGDVRGHVTLLADGEEGWINLVRLNNLGHKSSHKQPAITIDQLFELNKNIVCLSGCQASPFQQLEFGDAVKLGTKFKMVFESRFFIEMMDVNDFPHAIRAYDLSKSLKAKLVITNDVHFPYKEDAPIHKLLTQMKANFTYSDEELWLKTADEMLKSFRGISESTVLDAILRSGKIADKIESVSMTSAPSLPFIYKADDQLFGLISEALCNIDASQGQKDRALYEYKVISKMGYSAYFLILYDLIKKAKELDVKVGPGRGSGAGSYVLFLLGVTSIDPLVFDLPFERFLNEFRVGMPDVDVDFDHEHRHRLIEYAEQKWDAVPIATYSRYSHKSLVHDLSHVLKVPKEQELEMSELTEDSVDFINFCNENHEFKNAYNAILGQIRHKGKHAGGIVITNRIIPLERTMLKDEIVAAWTEGGKNNDLSQAGIVKFDLLGLSSLSVLRRLETKTGSKPKYKDTGSEFELFETGELTGIFQFSGSPGIMKYTRQFKPKTLNDLTMINALYRPGALDAGSADKFLEWRKSPRKFHPLIDPILAPTFGAIVFQEQVMAIVAAVIGGSLGEADEARRLIVKAKDMDEKWQKKFKEFEKKFLTAAKVKGIDGPALFEEIGTHARYSFNKAHATAYAVIAWMMAWWKWYYPTEFYAELINTDPGEAQAYIMSARKSGIKICPPDINISTNECVVYKNRMYLPFSIVKSVSPQTSEAIVQERNKEKFVRVEDFMKRVKTRVNQREALYAVGAFNCLIDFDGMTDEYIKGILKLRNAFETMATNEKQLRFMGLIIPNTEFIENMKMLTEKGYTVGIVSSVEIRTSKFGEYSVVHLTPSGVFWSRDFEIKNGQTVAVKVEKGKAKELTYL